MYERRVQWACFAASTICLVGGFLLGTVGVTMILFGLQSTDKLEDQVWEVCLLIIGAGFFVILVGAVGCAYSRSRLLLVSREQSIIKCIAFHTGMAELPDGGSVPPCCSNADAMKIWSTVNPHSRVAWGSDLPGQDENEEKADSE